MKIKIKTLLFVIFYISFFQGFFSDYLRMSFVNYLCDLLLIIVLVVYITQKRNLFSIFITANKGIVLTVFAFLILIVVGWCYNGITLLHALWGLRNYGRFLLYFYLCLSLFEQNDFQYICNFLIKVFPIHLLMIAFQITVEHLSYDYLGGIFGKYQGCAGGLMIYFGLIIILLFSRYDNKKISFRKLLVYLGIIIGIAAYAELKALFLLIFVIILIYALVSKNKMRSSIVVLLGLFGCVIGVQILIKYFPMYANFFSFDNLLFELTNKDASYTYRQGLDVGRSSIFYKLAGVIKNWGGNPAQWFGLGLGNGDYSASFNFLNGDFYNVFKNSNYMHFSLGFLFVEMGYLGVILYLAFFIFLEIQAYKNYMRCKNEFGLVGIFLPILCFFLIYYNSSLRTNFAYIIYALLPIILNGSTHRIDKSNK